MDLLPRERPPRDRLLLLGRLGRERRAVQHLEPAPDFAAHAHVEVRLRGLDVVVQVVAEGQTQIDLLRELFCRVNVSREDRQRHVADEALLGSRVSGDLGPVSHVRGARRGERRSSGDI